MHDQRRPKIIQVSVPVPRAPILWIISQEMCLFCFLLLSRPEYFIEYSMEGLIVSHTLRKHAAYSGCVTFSDIISDSYEKPRKAPCGLLLLCLDWIINQEHFQSQKLDSLTPISDIISPETAVRYSCSGVQSIKSKAVLEVWTPQAICILQERRFIVFTSASH